MAPRRESSEPQVVKALSHPLRVRALAILQQREASPTELADELGEPLGNVSYHVRTLSELGLIELVGTTPRRGAIEHHYRARSDGHLSVMGLTLDDQGWAALRAALRDLDERATAIESDSRERLAGGAGAGRHASLVVTLSGGLGNGATVS